MKLSLMDLTQYLKKQGITGHYVLQGDDPYLQQQAQTALTQVIDATTEVLRFSTTHASVWDELASRLQHRSLFSQKQLVFVEVTALKLTTAVQNQIKQWLATEHADFTLVFCIGKLNAKDKQVAWVKHVLANAHEVELTPPNSQRMPQWLKQTLAQKGLSTDEPGLQLLAHYFADNPGAALQEIEKIADYLGDRKHINAEELEQILVAQGQFTVFQLIDSCLAGKKAQTLQIFDMLSADESLAILITWMLAKELRLLVELSLAMATGETLTHLAKQHRLWPAKVALYQPLLKHYTSLQLWDFLNQLADIDKANKGLGPLPAQAQLQYILQRLASRQ